MSAACIKKILGFARSIDVAAVRAELDELDRTRGVVEVLLAAAEARDGQQPARPPKPDNGRMGSRLPAFDDELADRIEERLRMNQPQSDRVLAEDLGVADRAVSAACKVHGDRFRRVAVRGGQNVWGLVNEED